MMGNRLRVLVATSLTTLGVMATTSPAGGAVTLGQLAPGTPSASDCVAELLDVVQPTVTIGNTYVAPVTGTITSWSTSAGPGNGQHLFMKVFRKVAEPKTWMIVGHDGPRDLAPAVVNTFPTNIAVKAGDVLGLNTGDANIAHNACSFEALGELYDFHMGPLPEGQPAEFGQGGGARLNVTAQLNPTNTVSFGTTTRNKKRGTATLTVNVPNPGELGLSGNGVKSAAAGKAATTVTAPGPVTLLVKAKGKKKRKLNQTGKVKVSPTITFAPAGGDPKSQSLKVKLIKR